MFKRKCVQITIEIGVWSSGSCRSASGSGDGAFMSGDGIGLGKLGVISSNFFFTSFMRLPKFLYAYENKTNSQIKNMFFICICTKYI